MKRKIAVLTGTRADYGIMKPLLKKIQQSKNLELKLIVTGMHLSPKFGKTIYEIKKDNFKIASKISLLPKKDSNYEMSISVGKGIILFSNLFKKLKPDINLILGDRDEMLSSAIAAYHMNIPVAHIHGGDRTKGGIDEYNRHAITKMSNIHFAASKKSYDRILKLGENPKFVFHTGSPAIDQIKENKITSKNELEKKYNLKFTGSEILLLQHPVTTQSEQSKKQIVQTLRTIVKLKNKTIAFAPNSDAGNNKILLNLKDYSKKYSFIKMYRTIPREDFLGMLKNCGVLVGNSSSGMIEASYFKIPVVNIGIRQEGRESGKNVAHVGFSQQQIFKAIKFFLNKKNTIAKNEFLYGKGNASIKIVRYLEKIKLDKELIKKQINY
jgi:UDP-N-acetylglucosamine 2-epimerase (non-hydrolysing)/GDP/UDP-N,N'-diacetylbacillosamine 2-epimerase (hydrolysing)